MRDLRHAKPGAVSHTERGLILDARCRFEQPSGLLDAQNLAHPVRATRCNQAAGQMLSLQCHAVEETQRRDCTVDRRGTGTALMLVDLKAAQIIR